MQIYVTDHPDLPKTDPLYRYWYHRCVLNARGVKFCGMCVEWANGDRDKVFTDSSNQFHHAIEALRKIPHECLQSRDYDNGWVVFTPMPKDSGIYVQYVSENGACKAVLARSRGFSPVPEPAIQTG